MHFILFLPWFVPFDLFFSCRPYAVNLFPHILRISHREEETIQETLSNVMPKICSSLVAFTSESEIKVYLQSNLEVFSICILFSIHLCFIA